MYEPPHCPKAVLDDTAKSAAPVHRGFTSLCCTALMQQLETQCNEIYVACQGQSSFTGIGRNRYSARAAASTRQGLQ